MGVHDRFLHKEDLELITSYDLVSSAHGLMGGIDLDVASSRVANEYVKADAFYTPMDDGLNVQEWSGKVYLFPPGGAYYWNKKLDKWKMTRSTSPTLISSHAVWFRKLYKSWLKRDVTQAVYFSNCPDMIRYEQKMFDFPICILKTPPLLVKNTSTGIKSHRTCTSFVLYLPPVDNSTRAVQRFIDIYECKGRILS
jgi:hypothetical protein